jgi:cystathionine beta-synthase
LPWLRENDLLLVGKSALPTLADVLAYRRNNASTTPLLVSVAPEDALADAVELLRRYGISQMPVISRGRVEGSLTENLLLRYLAGGELLAKARVADLQGPPFPPIESDAQTHEAYTLFTAGHTAVVVLKQGNFEGIVTRSDLLDFWAHNRVGEAFLW